MMAEKRELFFSFHKVTSYSMHITDIVVCGQTQWHHTTCLCWIPLEIDHPCNDLRPKKLPERGSFTGTMHLMSKVERGDTPKLTCM